MSQYAGSNWIKRSLKKELSPLGENVADLLGDVFAGIYHLDYKALERVNWDDPDVILFTLSYHSMSTVDSDELTRLVILSHDRKLRLEIRAVAPKRLELVFHQRVREGVFYHMCPTIEEHLNTIREHYK